MSDVVIKVENLSKYYRLGVINNGTLFRDIQTWMARKIGRDDPNAKIGSEKYDATKEGFWALKDLNFEIKRGDRVGIIGKNGAGKSTLLKILSKITGPTEGDVKIKGRISSLLEVGTGFHGELTGRENIYLNGAILGMKRAEITRKLDEIIDFSGIEKHIDTPVKRYSSGMYVRLAFAVAAHLDSEILIADEVLAVGDAEFQKKALGKMNDLSTGQGRTVLFVSHNMAQVKSLCNRGMLLERGRIVRQDDRIEDSIAWYLGTDANGVAKKTTFWENDGSFANPNFTPLRLEVLDENERLVTSGLDYNKNYFVRLTFNIEEYDSNVNFWIDVFKNLNFETNFIENADKPLKISKGKNVVQWAIKSRTLLPGKYVMSVGSTIKNTKWILFPKDFVVMVSFCVDPVVMPIFDAVLK